MNSEARIGAAGSDGGGDRELRVLLGRIAAHVLGRDACLREPTVDVAARPGAALAVDEARAAMHEIGNARDALRIAGRDDQALITLGEAHERISPGAHEAREIEVLEVKARDIDRAAREEREAFFA